MYVCLNMYDLPWLCATEPCVFPRYAPFCNQFARARGHTNAPLLRASHRLTIFGSPRNPVTQITTLQVERSSSSSLSQATESAGAMDASGGDKAGDKGRRTPHVASKARVDAKVTVGGGKASAATTQRAASLCRKWWLGPAAAALMQEDSWSRSHVAAYLLPEVTIY